MKAHGWCFTANLASGEEHDILDEPINDCRYMVWQYEEKSHQHIQGYVYWKNQRTRSASKKSILQWCGVEAHLTKADGTAEENKTYCTKEESRIAGPWEFGDMPKQGERTDLEQLWDSIKAEGGINDDLVEKNVRLVAQYGRRLREMNTERKWKPQKGWNRPMKVIVLYGDSGCGKTTRAEGMLVEEDTFMVNYEKGKEFSNYKGEKMVHFEEFHGQIGYETFKRLIEGKKMSVNVIYMGAMPWLVETVVITSNHAPRDWWPNLTEQDQIALSRRCTEIWKGSGVYNEGTAQWTQLK